MIYLDHVAAARPRPEAVSAMRPFLDGEFGDPGSLHSAGRIPRAAVRGAREAVARLAGRRCDEIVFTSGPAEAANLAIKGLFAAPGQRPARAIASAIESSFILDPLRRLARAGIETVLLPVDGAGRVDPRDLARQLERGAALVAIQAANPEIGTCQDLAPLVALARERGAAFLADASLCGELLPVPGGEAGPDLVILSSASTGGPAGAGALVVRAGVRLIPLIEGGTEEEGLRAGLPAVCLIAGFGAAAIPAMSERPAVAGRLTAMAAGLARRLFSYTGAVLTGDPDRRLPGHVSVCFDGVEGEALLLSLDRRGICASSGSACAREAGKASHVLRAIGLTGDQARGSLVFSLGRETHPAEIDRLLDAIVPCLERLRGIAAS